MALLDVAQTKKVTATISLEQSTAAKVDRYAAFINANADDVVNQALEYVFNKDKDFQKYLESPEEINPPQALRIKPPVEGSIKRKRGRPFRGEQVIPG